MFPRFLFSPSIIHAIRAPRADDKEIGDDAAKDPAKVSTEGDLDLRVASHSSADQALIHQFPKRSYLQVLKPWVYYPQNRTGFWQYFRRPFFLWGFPNVVIVCHTAKHNHSTALLLLTLPQTGRLHLRLRLHGRHRLLQHHLRDPHLPALQLQHHRDGARLLRRPGRQLRRLGHGRAQRPRRHPPRPAQRRRQGARDAPVDAGPLLRLRGAGVHVVRLGRADGRALDHDRDRRGGHDLAPGRRLCDCDGVCDGVLSRGKFFVSSRSYCQACSAYVFVPVN